jgi:hypothetical protein
LPFDGGNTGSNPARIANRERLADHHNLTGIASAATAVVIGADINLAGAADVSGGVRSRHGQIGHARNQKKNWITDFSAQMPFDLF